MTDVCLEVGARRVFACALDWPGWARSAKTEELALEALDAYAERYRPVVERAGLRFPKAGGRLSVVERLPGNATTDFGAPNAVATADHTPPTPAQARRLAVLLDAVFATFDEVVADAPATLRKGPRGGGRDRDAIVEHVVRAEAAYSRKLGLKGGDRAALLEAVAAGASGAWPTRYGVRRIAWHVLDHAWEIEDRTEP